MTARIDRLLTASLACRAEASKVRSVGADDRMNQMADRLDHMADDLGRLAMQMDGEAPSESPVSPTPLSDAFDDLLKQFPPRPTTWFRCLDTPGMWCRGDQQSEQHEACMQAGPLPASNKEGEA